VDTAQRYVEIALDGGFGELHRQGVQSAIVLATERGFDDDPLQVVNASSASVGAGYDHGCLPRLTRGCRVDRAITLN
jgi:hypothetical protein